MSITRRFLLHQDLVVVTHSGVVEDQEFVRVYRSLYADPTYRAGMDELADLRGVAEFRVSVDALRTVERLAKDRYEGSGERSRTAIVAPGDLSYGIARIYDALAADGPETVSVFRDLDPALAWLGRTGVRVDPDFPPAPEAR